MVKTAWRTAGVVAVLWSGVAVAQSCPGDLNGDNQVTVEEILSTVNSALSTCPPPALRFVDNGDGTVTDTHTGLMWEQKVPGSGCLHCAQDLYMWTQAVTEWLPALNLTGYGDWRLPNEEELETIVARLPDCGDGGSCIDPVFEPMSGSYSSMPYWASRAYWAVPEQRWAVDFSDGSRSPFWSVDNKLSVRAVRGTWAQP